MSLSCIAEPSSRLIEALVQIESKGNDDAVGDNGRAVGCLQIHKEVVDDVNRHYGTFYTYDDRKCPIKSREICRKYLVMHGGIRSTDEKYARIWNGGPKGHKKKSTKRYWRKVSIAIVVW
jgi:hypothetical protein